MTEYAKNAFEDSDLQQILEEIEGYEADKVSARAEAAGKCSALGKKIENAKKTAKNLGIPSKSLSALLKRRKLERQILDLDESVPEEEIEIYEDMTSGQFSFLSPVERDDGESPADGHEPATSPVDEAEQAEGEAVLSTVGKGKKAKPLPPVFEDAR